MPKSDVLYGLLAKAEASYAAGGSLSATTDAIFAAERLLLGELKYLQTGERPLGPDSGGRTHELPATGRFDDGITPVIHGRGAGSAYSASVFSRDLHVFLKAAGFAHAFSGGAGSEIITYTPSRLRANWVSAVLGAYTIEELVTISGFWCDAEFTIEDAGPAVFRFPGKGILAAVPSDAAVPAMTFQNPNTQPPIGINMAVALGSYAAAAVRRITFKLNRKISNAIPNLSATAGLYGFNMSPEYDPQLTLRCEATSLVGSPYHTSSGVNPAELRERKTAIAIGFGHGTGGTGNYNRIEFAAPRAVLINAQRVSETPDALFDLTFRLLNSVPSVAADDAFTIITK